MHKECVNMVINSIGFYYDINVKLKEKLSKEECISNGFCLVRLIIGKENDIASYTK